MSAFLGPIHNWLFGKIVFQNQLVEKIVEFGAKNNWLDDTIHVDRYGVLEQGALEDIVDESNIHGWLQERVDLVENKLAYIVTAFTDGHPERIMDICDVVYAYGKEQTHDTFADATEIYRHLEAILLNGMPCDHVNRVIDQSAEHVVWEQVVNIHEKYWTVCHGNIEYYDTIRESLITGILEPAGYALAVTGDHVYEIKKEA